MDDYPNSHILIIPNKGMDIGGFFYALKDIFSKNYSYRYILKLHTKTNDQWRDGLILNLVNKFDTIIKMFDNKKKFTVAILAQALSYCILLLR